MSRCFSFPPPGYESTDVGALIEWIKKDEKKHKKLRKEKQKKIRKQRKRARENAAQESQEQSHKRHETNEFQKLGEYQGAKADEQLGKSRDEGTKEYQKAKVDEIIEPMKKRNRMEERNRPNRSRSSCDGTHGCLINNSETVIPIRLPAKRLKASELLINEGQKSCSSCGRVDNEVSLKIHEPASLPGLQCIEGQRSPGSCLLKQPTLGPKKEQPLTNLVPAKRPVKRPETWRRHRGEGTNEFQKLGVCQGAKVYEHQKAKVDEIVEPMKKRNRMEEHNHPNRSCNSCDGIQNSNKREKLSSPPNGCQFNISETVIPIRLPAKRLKASELLINEGHKSCSCRGKVDDEDSLKMQKLASLPGLRCIEGQRSTSENMSPPMKLMEDYGPPIGSLKRLTHREKKSSPGSCVLEQPTLGPRKVQPLTNLVPTKHGMKRPVTAKPPIIPSRLRVQLQDLIDNLVPVPVQKAAVNVGDDEWLRTPKCLNRNSNTKGLGNGSITANWGGPTDWPRACFLPEADVYALPFTIPL